MFWFIDITPRAPLAVAREFPPQKKKNKPKTHPSSSGRNILNACSSIHSERFWDVCVCVCVKHHPKVKNRGKKPRPYFIYLYLSIKNTCRARFASLWQNDLLHILVVLKSGTKATAPPKQENHHPPHKENPIGEHCCCAKRAKITHRRAFWGFYFGAVPKANLSN